MSENQFGNQGWTPDRISSLEGKTYVITGTTSGTGYEAARILLSKGARVVMLNRNAEKTQKTISVLRNEIGQDIDVSFIQMDLGEQDSVKAAADEVLKSIPQIDALLCNAAIA
jgi:NAD(P)-dependent dehydrogenase (short-subunit alcohol dehydrogenase family)